MKYIIEFEDEPCMREDGLNFYKCIQAPWWGLSERVIKQLTPYQPDHNADVSKKASISCGQENDLISRRAALKELAVYIHLIDKTMGEGTLTDDDCMESAKSVLGEDELPAAQPETNWIPCSERFPEYNKSVLTWDGYIFCIEKRIPYIRDDDGEPIEGDWWVDDEYDEYESEFYPNLRDGAAIAWMPLPEPYKGGDSE